MAEVTCPDCGVSWSGYGAIGFLRRHACIGTPSPTVDDLLAFMGAEIRDHGCLIPTRNVSPYRRGNGYWWIPRAVGHVIGEYPAHRAVLRLKLGRPIQTELYAAHECKAPHYENSKCVNPEHVQERTRAENVMWMSPELRSQAFGGYDKVDRIRLIAAANRGRKRDPEVVERGAAKRRGKKLSDEARANMRAAWTRRREQLQGQPKDGRFEQHVRCARAWMADDPSLTGNEIARRLGVVGSYGRRIRRAAESA